MDKEWQKNETYSFTIVGIWTDTDRLYGQVRIIARLKVGQFEFVIYGLSYCGSHFIEESFIYLIILTDIENFIDHYVLYIFTKLPFTFFPIPLL